MNWIKYLVLQAFVLCFMNCSHEAQAPAENKTTNSKYTRNTNRNYFKVCFLNENNEVLLVKYKGIWEFIGGEYNTSVTLQNHVQKLAMTSNIKVNDIRLRGLFNVYWNNIEKPDVYHYYSARYESGELKTPGDCEDAVWANLEKARELITYTDMLKMYELILESEHLWGATYHITKDKEKGTREVELMVDYFKFN